MIELIVTEAGHRLAIGRIHRDVIDQFAGDKPPPEPPIRTAAEMGIKVFGGLEDDEEILDWDDQEYLEAATAYNLTFWNDRLELLASEIKPISGLTDADQDELIALEEIHGELDHVGLLRYIFIKSELDAAQAVLAVLYNSTVTIGGVREAAKRYGVKWKERPVPIEIRDSPLWAGREFSDRRTARYCGYTWHEFCQLTGPEQSSFSAFHLLDVRVNNIRG